MTYLQLVTAQSDALKENGKLEVRNGDYIITYRHKRFLLSWKDNHDKVQTALIDEESAKSIHKKVSDRKASIMITVNGKMRTFSFMHNPKIKELDPDIRFEPEEIPKEEQQKNIKRLNLEKMKAIQKANPKAWEQAKKSDSSFQSMSNILKTQKK